MNICSFVLLLALKPNRVSLVGQAFSGLELHMLYTWCLGGQKLGTVLDLCLSSLRRGHANLLCIVPILSDDPRRESIYIYIYICMCIYIYTYTEFRV